MQPKAKFRSFFSYKIQLLVGLIISIGSLTSGCKKLVDVDTPITSITGANVYENDATSIAVTTGIYASISRQGIFGPIGSMSLLPSLSADELLLFGNNVQYISYYQNELTSLKANGQDFWYGFYSILYSVNSSIEGVGNSTGITPAVKSQLIGEAKFIRAFCYFYLINLYGDVPLVTGTDYSVNRLLARIPKVKIWQQIVNDLTDAQNLLNENYLDGTLLNSTTERVRPTKWAATSLLSRAYLYQREWDSAEIEATKVISNSSMYNLDPLNGVFLANSSEAIWQLLPVNAGENTKDATLFILPASGPDGYSFPVVLDTLLVNSFEPGDQRRQNWVDSVVVGNTTYYYPYKYKAANMQPVNNVYPSPTEYTMVLRLGEQYLIRAEAEAQLNNLSHAKADLDSIRNRAGLDSTTASSQADILSAIYHERRVELFTEWGHRWLDLKRIGALDSVMNIVTPLKGGSWYDYKQWYPISLYEIQNDPNLVQNSGY